MAITVAVASAADVVVLKSQSGRPATRVSGTIVEYGGIGVQVTQSSGSTATLAVDRVDRIETEWTAEHVEADRLAAAGRFAEAVDKYLAAFRVEKRRWAKRWILAELARSYRNLGQIEKAGNTFLIVLDDDPGTPFLDALPLSWKPHRPAPGLETRAKTWLAAESPPAAVLMGASWLLSSAERQAAIRALTGLRDTRDVRLARLADAQLARTKVVTAKPADADELRRKIEALEAGQRAGPYFVLGRTYSRLGRNEEAALALMRVPILYSSDRVLAADALRAAAAELETLKRPQQATGLYREVAVGYPGTVAAAEAKVRLEALAQPADSRK